MRKLFQTLLILSAFATAISFCLPWEQYILACITPEVRVVDSPNLQRLPFHLQLSRSGLQQALGIDTRTGSNSLQGTRGLNTNQAVSSYTTAFFQGRPRFTPLLTAIAVCALIGVPLYLFGHRASLVAVGILTLSVVGIGLLVAGIGLDWGTETDLGKFPFDSSSGIATDLTFTDFPSKWVFLGGLVLTWVFAVAGLFCRPSLLKTPTGGHTRQAEVP